MGWNRLAEIRELTGKSIKDIQEGCGVGWATISRWSNEGEKDRMDLTVARRLCNYFKIPLSVLIVDYVPSDLDTGLIEALESGNENKGKKAA